MHPAMQTRTPTTRQRTMCQQHQLRSRKSKTKTLACSTTCRSCSSNCKISRTKRCARCASTGSRTWFSCAGTAFVNSVATKSKVVPSAERPSKSVFYCISKFLSNNSLTTITHDYLQLKLTQYVLKTHQTVKFEVLFLNNFFLFGNLI